MAATRTPQHEWTGPNDRPDGEPEPEVDVVTVFSAKGGAGATMLATNLALALRDGGARVCLLDLSLAFGDVAVSLQLAPRRTVMDAVELGVSSETVHELITTHPSGLDCVLSPVDPSGAERVSPEVVRALITALRSRYDIVIVDTASELSEHVLEAFDAADLLLLVTTLEIPAIKNTRIALDMLDLVGHPREQRRIVLNQADAELGLTADDVETALRCSLSGKVPSDHGVPVSVNGGAPIVLAQPTHPVSRAIQDLAMREIFGIRADAPHRTGRSWRRRRLA